VRVALYIRVSTRKQSLRPQLHALREFVRAREGGEDPWKIVRVYRDRRSGKSPSRASYSKMLADAAFNRFDLVAVWKLDRFGRSTPEILRRVRELDARGVRFCCSSQGGLLDTSSSSGKLIVGVLALVAELEHDLNSERTVEGIKAVRRRGAPAAARGRRRARPGAARQRPKHLCNRQRGRREPPHDH
jgi:DNA invertase Pin-like site-specific DNA recombinase